MIDVYASGETIKEIIKIFKRFEFDYNLEILIFCYRNYIFD
ncbi:ComFC, Predicted amidophosphoribosyltransferase [Brachyspira hampsonii 30599]|nr:ComFC, Predicted amidophosphoribosyltransferase [Brachyspira hampsonii 30599]